jgi:hypothetical protein
MRSLRIKQYLASTLSYRYVQYDGIAAGHFHRLSGPGRQNGPRERRHVGERAERGIGLIFTNDPEALLACEFRRNPAGDSDLMSATVPI